MTRSRAGLTEMVVAAAGVRVGVVGWCVAQKGLQSCAVRRDPLLIMIRCKRIHRHRGWQRLGPEELRHSVVAVGSSGGTRGDTFGGGLRSVGAGREQHRDDLSVTAMRRDPERRKPRLVQHH